MYELIFIGDKFYNESSTIMSSIYTIDGRRSDWGFVQVTLSQGESVYIRPATKVELAPYIEKLNHIKSRKENKNAKS